MTFSFQRKGRRQQGEIEASFKLLLRHPTDVLSITHSHRHHTARLICLDDPSHCLASEVYAFFVSHPKQL